MTAGHSFFYVIVQKHFANGSSGKTSPTQTTFDKLQCPVCIALYEALCNINTCSEKKISLNLKKDT